VTIGPSLSINLSITRTVPAAYSPDAPRDLSPESTIHVDLGHAMTHDRPETSSDPAHELREALLVQERSWNGRPLVQQQYRDWYGRIVRNLSDAPGPTVELGSGIGRFREARGDAILTDVVPTPWADTVADAQDLPYADDSIGNLVLLDVLHHLSDVSRFLNEATRVLKIGGRVVIVDPYCSPVSTVFYRSFHHERTDLSMDAFEEDLEVERTPLESNQARATLVFYRHCDEFRRRWPQLRVVRQERFAFVAYPLSGGFTRRPLVPSALGRSLGRLERLLSPLSRLLAFRCLVVLEREP